MPRRADAQVVRSMQRNQRVRTHDHRSFCAAVAVSSPCMMSSEGRKVFGRHYWTQQCSSDTLRFSRLLQADQNPQRFVSVAPLSVDHVTRSPMSAARCAHASANNAVCRHNRPPDGRTDVLRILHDETLQCVMCFRFCGWHHVFFDKMMHIRSGSA